MHLWIISQVFASFALIAIVIAYQLKNKKWTLVAVMVFNGTMAVSSAVLANWILVGIYAIGFFRDATFLWREKYYPNAYLLSVIIVCAFMAGSVVVGAFTFRWWFDVPLVAASMFVDFGSWKKGVHWIRISRATWCAMVLVNHVRYQNYIAIGIEIFILISVAIFYIRYFRKKERGEIIEPEQIQNSPVITG